MYNNYSTNNHFFTDINQTIFIKIWLQNKIIRLDTSLLHISTRVLNDEKVPFSVSVALKLNS